MINIVFVGRTPFPNGNVMTKRHKHILEFLKKCKDVYVHKYASWDTKKWENQSFGIFAENIDYYNTKYPKSLIAIPLISLECCKYLKTHYKKNDRNILFLTATVMPELLFPVIYAKLLGYKIVMDAVENYSTIGIKLSFSLRFAVAYSKYVRKKIDGLFVISTKLKEYYEKELTCPICLLPNSTPLFNVELKKKFNIPFKIVYAGSFAEKDGLNFLIRGYKMFCEKCNIRSELILIGKGNLNSDLEDIIIHNKNIRRLGFVTDEELYSNITNADVLCMTRCNSQFANYGFPFKLSEYLATGNPVLATMVGDVPTILKDGVNAFLVKPESDVAISNKLVYIYNHMNESLEIGWKGRDVVNKYFDIDKNGETFLNFIKNIV